MTNVPIIIGEAVTYIPPIFRYLEEEYVDSFFADGSLRLSTFIRFSQLEDEQRQDEMEGRTLFIHRNEKKGGQTLSAWMNHGIHAYILSASMSLRVQLLKDFNYDSVFEISNPMAFGQEVAKSIPGFLRMIIGPCFYQIIKVIERDLGYLDDETLEQDKNRIKDLILNTSGWHPYFQKPTRYSNQSEFRIVWLIENEPEQHINIKVPEAIKYCKPIKVKNGLFMDENIVQKSPGPPDKLIKFSDI